jgi:lipid A 3-O-deacylase
MTCKKNAIALTLFSLLAQIPLAQAADIMNLPSMNEFRQVRDAGKTIWMLELDNDSFLLNKDDRFYTAGDHLQETFIQHTDLQSLIYGWRAGQDLYTATDVKLLPAQIPRYDHPYAGWLYAGVFGKKADINGRSWGWGLDIGCLGPCAGGAWTQTQLHHLIRQPLPQGWSTQFKNEPGVVISGDYSPGRLLPFAGVDVTPGIKGRFGNIFTDASAQIVVRAGELNKLDYQRASYAFFRAEAKWTGYNATLQGGYFNDEPARLTIKHRGGELEAGYLWQGDKYGVSASLIRRANEIAQITNATGDQNFIRLQFYYAMQ